jgi:hypothetical protein
MDDEDEQTALMDSVQIDMPIHTNSNTVSLNPGIFKNYKKYKYDRYNYYFCYNYCHYHYYYLYLGMILFNLIHLR